MTDTHTMPPHQRVIRWLSTRLLDILLCSYSASGLEHVPRRGPYILAANHLSYYDAPLVLTCLPPQRIVGFAARKYRDHIVFAPIMRLMDIIWVTQWEADREALSDAERALRTGFVLGMAPEGTRSPTGALIPARGGVAFLATRTEVPILPAAIEGTDRVKVNAWRLRRTELRLTIGAPFRLAPITGRGRSRQLDERTDVIMAHIARMLPPHYRGVYADHPLLHELERTGGPLPGQLPV
jgi:1-acyl-sn-glycerol-3-phosphate acyltransferase